MSGLALQERRSVVARLGAQGLTAAAIAREVGVRYQTVINDAKIVRVALKKPEDWWGYDDREATLRQLHADGVLFEEIASLLGCSVSRAKSKAARLKLPPRTDAGKRRAEAPKAEAPPPPPPKVERPRLVVPEGPGVPLIGIRLGLCKWPKDLTTDSPADMICCGLPAKINRLKRESIEPYCVGHMQIAYYPSRPRKGRRT